jgi:hypothetical protein
MSPQFRWPLVVSIPNSVPHAVGPSVNTWRAQLLFASNPKFGNLFEFSATKIHSKINVFHTLALKIVK